MKIDPNIYQEAHRLAIMPRMKMLFYGLICGAAVPTMYLRTYYLPHMKVKDAADLEILGRQVSQLEQRTQSMESSATSSKTQGGQPIHPFVENMTKTNENLGALGGVGEIPIAAWHIGGRNKYANDDKYRKLVDEANEIMFSSII